MHPGRLFVIGIVLFGVSLYFRAGAKQLEYLKSSPKHRVYENMLAWKGIMVLAILAVICSAVIAII